MTTPSSTRRYKKATDAERSRGIYRTTDASAAREHLRSLRAAGGAYATIEHLTRMSTTSLRDITAGRTQAIRTSHERRILAIRAIDLYHAPSLTSHVPGAGAARRLEALLALGWGHEEIRAEAGVQVRNVRARRDGRITLAKHLDMRRAYDVLSMRVGPSDTARRRAARMGYAPPLAWDDHELDDPTASEPDRGRWEAAA